MKRDLDFTNAGTVLGIVLALIITAILVPKAEGVDIKFEPLTARDIFMAAALGRGETPEQAVKTAEKCMHLREQRR